MPDLFGDQTRTMSNNARKIKRKGKILNSNDTSCQSQKQTASINAERDLLYSTVLIDSLLILLESMFQPF